MVTQEQLKQSFHYDSDTGIFTRLKTCGRMVKGTVLSYCDQYGYLSCRIGDRQHRAHRLAFLYMEGEFPKGLIDHINRNRTDNRWSNLRRASPSLNTLNSARRSDNLSGYRGVGWCKQKEKWRARITIHGRERHIGFFDNLEEASEAYLKEAEKWMHIVK